MKELVFPEIKERLYHEILPNGLRVYLLPKLGFHKVYATFTTQYGSIDNHFQLMGGDEFQVPDGIAHFLEHKLFEKEDGDIFQQFSKQGASANAFTTFDRTSYLFSSTEQVEENLTTLLDFVQSPYFTEKTVEKEKGIIAQEIRMYEDSPDFLLYFNLLKGLFHQHPVHTYIAGTVESIQEITAEMLYTCYEHFYHPSNMILFVIGSIEPQEIMKLIRHNQSQKKFRDLGEIQRFYPYEPENVAQSITELSFPVGISKCMVGFKEKENGELGEALLLRELTTLIILEVLVGKSSPLYQSLYHEGLIGEDFGADYSGEFTYGYSMFAGDTPDPDRFVEHLKEGIFSLQEKGITSEQFERSKKKKIGAYLRSLNSLEFIANQYTRYKFNEMDLFAILPVIQRLDVEKANQRLREHFSFEQMAISIIRSSS